MTKEVHIVRDWPTFSLKVFIREVRDNGAVFSKADGRQVYISGPANTEAESDLVFCYIPHGAEHALLGALSHELGAVEHPQQLRADYEHLRGRHDLLVDRLLRQDNMAEVVVVELAQQLARPRR